MFELFKAYQLDLMFAFSAACLCFVLMLLITRFLDKQTKYILIFMEITAGCLLFSDRLAYIYAGDKSFTGFVMVRVSNFLVFFLTPAIVYGFNLYLNDLLMKTKEVQKSPVRITIVSMLAITEMILVVISQITGLFYYFDENNVYHRGPGFLLCYIIPVICPLIQYTVIQEYRRLMSKWIYGAMVAYIFVPIVMAIIQIFAYGVSIVNMSMAIVSISLYVFTYLDINDTVLNAHNREMKILEEEKKSAKRLFDQTATAFMAAVEQRDEYSVGHASRVSKLAREIAVMMGKSEEECDEVYYAALLHNVGLVSIPDEVLEKKEKLTDEERKIIERVPVLSSEILSSIGEYPYLQEAALYSHERYDGSGYPLMLRGNTIPEIARIVGVVDAYDAMTSRRSYRGPLPLQTIREEFIKQAGIKFDPEISALMVKILDKENSYIIQDIPTLIESELECGAYRDATTVGIPMIQEITRIHFKVVRNEAHQGKFSEPVILLFDAFDGYVHDNKKAIDAYHYLEYGEIWFDGRIISTAARNIHVESVTESNVDEVEGEYEIIAAKYEDHIKLELLSPKGKVDVIVALPDRSKAAYMALSGESCRLYNIKVEISNEKIREVDIPKIVEADNYTNRMESDLANVQIDQYRSESTRGVLLEDKLKLDFHTMSLPSSNLVWHCPYIVIYTSDDKRVNGANYKEFALIKLNGEISTDENVAENKFSMKKKDIFPGWDVWKEQNKVGMECSVSIVRKGNNISLSTENMGILIDNVTTIKDDTKDVYVTITGDQVALTDIRIS